MGGGGGKRGQTVGDGPEGRGEAEDVVRRVAAVAQHAALRLPPPAAPDAGDVLLPPRLPWGGSFQEIHERELEWFDQYNTSWNVFSWMCV